MHIFIANQTDFSLSFTHLYTTLNHWYIFNLLLENVHTWHIQLNAMQAMEGVFSPVQQATKYNKTLQRI